MTRLQELETVVKALFAVPDQSVGLTGDQSKGMNKYLARMSGLGGIRMLTSLAMLAGLSSSAVLLKLTWDMRIRTLF